MLEAGPKEHEVGALKRVVASKATDLGGAIDVGAAERGKEVERDGALPALTKDLIGIPTTPS